MTTRRIAFQHRVKEILRDCAAFDADSFASRFSLQLDFELDREPSPTAAITRALAATKTTVFSTNRGLSRDYFKHAMAKAILPSAPRSPSLDEAIVEFVGYAESQLARSLKRGSPEEILRSSLGSFLRAKGYPVVREAHEGAGQTDLLVTSDGDIIEAKVPASNSEYQDGWTEAAQYAQSARREEAHYVFVDHCRDLSQPRWQEEQISHRVVDGIAIRSYRIRVAEVPPSKVGAARRTDRRRTS